MTEPAPSEATRLESLWAGGFGNAYLDRNPVLDGRRDRFWTELLGAHPIRSVLEIGCGQGANLGPIARLIDPVDVWGVDVNGAAIERARSNAPGINVVASVARRLPFRDGLVDLAFTMGVLIHQPPATLPVVIAEIVRCSRRFVLWGEYYAASTEEVDYRGASGALYRRDYGAIYRELFPDLIVRAEGFLTPEDGFDRVTWELLEKP
ncbi:MAG: pseudaminic acid biosynthesis-associated methylase [Chloroflexota bacterium]